MGSMIVPMEPIDHLTDGNGDLPSSHATRPRRPKFLNMAAVPIVKKTMAEFLGTFILMFAQVCAIIMDEKHDGVLGLMGIAVSVGLAVMVLVFSLIHICGCHMNPAVSIAMAVYGHLPPAHIVPYIAAQVLGSTAASFVGNAIYHPGSRKIGTVPSVGTVEAFAVEFILTFVLLFVITAVAMDPHAVKELIAVAMAASVDGVWRQALTEYLEHRVPGWLKKLLGLSTDGRMEEEEEGEGDNEEEDEDEGEGAVAMELNLEQRLTLLLLLAILAAILAYHAMASPPLHNLVNYQRLAFSIVFITSLSIIAMLANRKLPAERGVRWHAMWVCVILDVVGLTCAFAATWGWGYWKISTIDVIVLPLAVLLCIAFHVALAITGTPKGLVQNLLSKLGLPPVLFAGGPDQSPQDDGTQHDYEFGMTGGTNEEPLGVEVASPILGGAFTLIVAVPVLSIVTIPVKLLVGIMIASIGVGLWQRLLARLLRALPSALQRLQGTTPPTGSSSPPQPVHGMCKLIHTMCSETWISIIISVMWVPSLRQNLKLKFKMSKIFSVLGVLADSAPTPNMTTATATTATAASTTTTAIVDTPSTTTSTVMGTPPITDLSNHDASSVTSMGREVQPLVEPRPRRNRRPNSRLIGSDWVN